MSAPPEQPPLRLFVYGTLKRGERNHDRFCAGFASVEEATVRGRIYDLPYGFPALVVPAEDVHAVGTADYVADANLPHGARVRERAELPGWDSVHGELMTFGDPTERLPAVDGLERFRPGEEGFYTRVLVPVTPASSGEPVLAWAYSAAEGSGVYLPGGTWPA
ncbi:gamma-glutamylcyclotransferase [Rubrobacter marinus]|uniref:Gamma-glutamylcyclotransferase n=1 Tax=Rubrobacter marinus TaxID=2653852 RepID=A0A6G8Q2Q9_9ACTN|nr:gamma-glutamylcyclotransferase [Rubrobacter marinus]